MKQIFQSLSTGSIEIVEVPTPAISSGNLLIRTSKTLLSAGTERMLLDFGRANLIEKARQQPEKVKQVLEKAKNEGPFNAIDAVRSKLNNPLPLGYCNIGRVIGIGEGVTGFKEGDRVVSNGPHSEIVNVPKNLCSLIPSNVSDEEAVFTILSSIGLQGIRLAEPTLGETFLVSGLGLIGLLTGQLLAAQGCRVLGIDINSSRCHLAESLGITSHCLSETSNPLSWCQAQTDGNGIDGAIITAATSSNSPIDLASQACRQRGRIVLVGVTGLELRRELFYKKELSFQVSCSYGPGRYDASYEEDGNDYPFGLVRWTEQRNFQAVLNVMSQKRLITEKLISHKFLFEKANEAYETMATDVNHLGIILEYDNTKVINKQKIEFKEDKILDISLNEKPSIGFIGAGNYASRILLPNFKKCGAFLHTIASKSGSGISHIGKKFNFLYATTDLEELINSSECDAIIISTRHDSHGDLVLQSLKAGKHVYVEKPLCLNINELRDIETCLNKNQILMVGYNRRFAPLVDVLKNQINKIEGPKALIYTCNAGYIPKDHWTQKPQIGGGRLIGEACHFLDLICYLVEDTIIDIHITNCKDIKSCPDTFSLQMCFKNGSIATINYFSNGHKSFPKERLEVFGDQKVLQLDNFRKLKGWGLKNFKNQTSFYQDKGQKSCVESFLKAIQYVGEDPIERNQIFEVQRWLLEAIKL